MELYILRHGEAGKRQPTGNKDSERALTVTGRQEVREMAKGIQELDIKFDLIATSPLKRAQATAEIVAKALKVKRGMLEEWNELKPEGKRPELYHRLSQFKQGSSILVVGHEPYLSTMIGEIVFGNGTSNIVLKKAGLARIGMKSFVPGVKGELKWLLTPKHLKNMN